MVCDNKQPQMNAKSVFFSKISISGGPGPCLAGIAIRKPHKIAIAIRKQHPSIVFDAKSRLSIEVFLRPRSRYKTKDLGGPRGRNPDTKQRILIQATFGDFCRAYPTTRTSVPTPPSRAHPKDDARSKQLPQITFFPYLWG